MVESCSRVISSYSSSKFTGKANPQSFKSINLPKNPVFETGLLQFFSYFFRITKGPAPCACWLCRLCLRSRVRAITVGTISMACQLMAEDTRSTICTETSSKFLESMSLSGPSAVGRTALYGNDPGDSLLC